MNRVKLNVKKAHRFSNNSRNVSCCSFNRLNQSLFVFTVCAVAALANAADPDDQIYQKSPDKRFGFRDSFARAAKTEESEVSDRLAIDVVEISSKRVVLRSPKEALTPIDLRREPYWSNDSKRIALSFQTGPRTWTAKLYEWDGKEFAEVSWPRDAIRKRIEEEQAAQLKALGLPESTPRKLVYEGFTALGWVDATLWWVDFTSTRQGK